MDPLDPLLASFRAHLARPDEVDARSGEIGSVLAELVARARAAHPEVAVDGPALAAALATRRPPDLDLGDWLARARATDLLLVCGCLAGDGAALRAFDTLLTAEVAAGARSVNAPGGLADEVKQRLRESLLVGSAERGPAVADYAARGDLRGFLRISVVRECLRLMKRQQREIGVDDDALDALGPVIDPELDRLKATYRAEFTECFVEALGRLAPRERAVLRYHAVERLTIDQIGALYAVHRATAARWIERARVRAAELTEELLGERLALAEGDVASVIRLVRSRIDVTLERLLAQR